MGKKHDISTRELEEAISVASKGDASRFLHPTGKRVQSLKGFDDDYIDIVDYILRCTHKIWEDGGIGEIYGHYLHTIPIETADGFSYGREQVIAATTQVRSAFPDVRLYGDDVIWMGNEDDGFHTSHRITWTGTNTGCSKYGPPTGKKIFRFGIANCLVKENLIIEEWIARDEMSLVLQLGYDPWRLAAKMVRSQGGKPFAPDLRGDLERVNGQDVPDPVAPFTDNFFGDGFDVNEFIRHTQHEIWNWRFVNKVSDYYVENYQYFGPSGRNLYGRGNLKAHILSLLSAFPDLKMSIDHLYWNGSEQKGYRAAVRWTIQGTHEQNGIYGVPTGKRIRLMGISHMHIKGGKFIKEYTAFDEFALFKQLYTPDIHGYDDSERPEEGVRGYD